MLKKSSSKGRASSALGGKKGSGMKPRKMIVDRNHDDSFQITHQHDNGMPEEKFSARNVKHLVRHTRQAFAGPQDAGDDGMAVPNSFEDGGMVQKSGMAMVHAGEKVVPAPPMFKNPDITLGGPAPKVGTRMPANKMPSVKQSQKQIEKLRKGFTPAGQAMI